MSIIGKRVCITGGAGFIGSHLVERLIENNEVVVYDNLHRNAIQFAHLDGHPHLHFVKGDVMDYDASRKAIDKCHVVIHCAAIAGVQKLREGSMKRTILWSSVAFALAMSVADVTMPDRLPSMIARFTPAVRPKSSAFTISRRTG